MRAATSMRIDRVVVELHAKSGLWAESSAAHVLDRRPHDLGLLCLPRCLSEKLGELARRFSPRLHQGIPGKGEIHRAMPDIEDSLTLCRYYAAHAMFLVSSRTC